MRSQFLALKKTAHKGVSSSLMVYSAPATARKLAVVIPKKAKPLATARNKLRRMLQKSLLERVRTGLVVAIVKPHKLSEKQNESVQRELESLLKKNNVV